VGNVAAWLIWFVQRKGVMEEFKVHVKTYLRSEGKDAMTCKAYSRVNVAALFNANIKVKDEI